MSNVFEREMQVLGPGVGQGVEKAAQETWGNITSGIDELSKHPLSATGSYLSNHWKDLVAGGLISFVTPRGIAGKLLAAWSLRGVGMATVGAAAEAYSPDANVSNIRDRFSTELGHQGAAFASSLPLTLAGGALGRMGANAVFGPNLAAADLVSGKIGMSDVRTNIGNLAEQIHPRPPKVLVTDLDDTTFSLKSYLAPSLQRNVNMIAERMNMSEADVIKALGPQRIHPWFLEESPLARQWKGSPSQFTEQIVKPFWQNDSAVLQQELKPYPGVVDTLQTARDNGVKVVALTNAPVAQALRRVKAAGIDGYIDHLYAMKTEEPAVSNLVAPEAIEHGRQITAEALNTPNKVGQIHELPPGSQKPSINGLGTVLSDLGAKPNRSLAIGDNWDNDGAAPAALGVPFVWAKYGKSISPEAADFLRRFKPRADETLPEDAVPKIDQPHPPTVAVADSYSDLMRFLNRKPNYGQAWNSLTVGIRPRSLLMPTLGFDLLNEGYQQS